MNPSFKEYQIIQTYYGEKRTKRSDVRLMNHIDEGLTILDLINASDIAKRAYCLHPIFQDDENLVKIFTQNKIEIDVQVLIAVMEYRSVANAYLSKRVIQKIEEIRLSPLKDVNDMLITDKIQNRKDFELYHKETHPRSEQLAQYFSNWFLRLNISESLYHSCVSEIMEKRKN